MIVGRNQHGAGFLLDRGRCRLTGGEVWGAGDDSAAVFLDSAAFDGRSTGRHDDVGGNAAQPGDEGEGLGMVAGAVGDNTAGGLGIAQAEDGIGSAAELE